MSSPAPIDYGIYNQAIVGAEDATQALREAAADLADVRKALDPHRQSVPPDSECQRQESDVEVIERLVAERAEWEKTSHHVSESAQHWTRSFNKIMAEIGWPHGSGELCTECILEWIRRHKNAKPDDASILLGLRAAAILTADHDCGEEHDDAMEALQAKIAALSADGARSMVEADERQREETRKVREQAGWPADPVDRGYSTFYFSELAKWPDTPPAAPTLHTIVALPDGLTLDVPHDVVYQLARVGDVLRYLHVDGRPVASIVKTADGARVEKETAPPLHPGQYVATKEKFDAACRADTYTETRTVGGLSNKPSHAPKIQVGQVWQERDGRMAAVTRLPPAAREGPLFQFNVATGEVAVGGTFSPGYGVIFDCEHDLVNTNGCKLVAGPGSPWSEK